MADNEKNRVDRPFHLEGDLVVFDPIPDPKDTAEDTRKNEAHEFQRDIVQANERIASFNGMLVVATLATICVGIWQGNISQTAANAAKEAADSACLGSQVARSTLSEYQRSAEDSHRASIATYAQALVAMQSQKAFVDADFTVPGNRPYGKPLSLLVHLKNTGKSDASNVRFTTWVIIAKPNSGATSVKPKKQLLTSIQKGSMRVGEWFFPDIPGTTKEGNPHGLYIPALNERDHQFIDTPELDRAAFAEHKMAVFAFYTISYEDFTAQYSRNVCTAQFIMDNSAPPVVAKDFDKVCSAYNNQTEIQKILMPPPSNTSPAKVFPEITCPVGTP